MIKKKNIISVLVGLIFISFYTVGKGATVEDININQHMKQEILHSSLKANLRTKDGHEMVAYLYAENEFHEKVENYSCLTGGVTNNEIKTGDYRIYLYDIKSGSFLPTRLKPFPELDELSFNTDGADLIVLSGSKQNKSDVLLISQFGACSGNFFEAYGFSNDNTKLQRYSFLTNKLSSGFYGRISLNQDKNNIIAYGVFEKDQMMRLALSLSSTPGVIQLKPI